MLLLMPSFKGRLYSFSVTPMALCLVGTGSLPRRTNTLFRPALKEGWSSYLSSFSVTSVRVQRSFRYSSLVLYGCVLDTCIIIIIITIIFGWCMVFVFKSHDIVSHFELIVLVCGFMVLLVPLCRSLPILKQLGKG